MAYYRTTVTDEGAAALTELLALGLKLNVTRAQAGDGVSEISANMMTELVNPIFIDCQLGEKEYDGSTLSIPVQASNKGLTDKEYVRELATYALNAHGNTIMFTYSRLVGGDSDNVLPPTQMEDGSADTIHMHNVGVVITNAEAAAITVTVGAGSNVTQVQMENYAAPKEHTHDADDVAETTGESVEQAQRRQDFAITALQSIIDSHFSGATLTLVFTPDQRGQWLGYDTTGLPEGVLDAAANRLYA